MPNGLAMSRVIELPYSRREAITDVAQEEYIVPEEKKIIAALRAGDRRSIFQLGSFRRLNDDFMGRMLPEAFRDEDPYSSAGKLDLSDRLTFLGNIAAVIQLEADELPICASILGVREAVLESAVKPPQLVRGIYLVSDNEVIRKPVRGDLMPQVVDYILGSAMDHELAATSPSELRHEQVIARVDSEPVMHLNKTDRISGWGNLRKIL